MTQRFQEMRSMLYEKLNKISNQWTNFNLVEFQSFISGEKYDSNFGKDIFSS